MLFFYGGKIVLQLLLLCEYCHYNACYSEVHQCCNEKKVYVIAILVFFMFTVVNVFLDL